MPCSYCGWVGQTGPRGAEQGIVKGLCKPCYYYQKRFGTLVRPEKGRSKCSVEGCDRDVVSHGYCDLHWYRVKKYGDPALTSRPADWGDREKHPLYQSWQWACRTGVVDEWKEFWTFVKDVGARPKKHRLKRVDESLPFGPSNAGWVEILLTGSTDAAHYAREHRKANPDYWRDVDLRRKYKIGLDEFNRILEAQGGVCAICGQKEKAFEKKYQRIRNLAVDHCHDTGKVRALLCTQCNQGIGSFRHDPLLTRKATEYLEQHA